MNKTGLVNEVKVRLGVSTARARAVVDMVLEEMASAVEHGERIALRGFGFTPAGDAEWASATDNPVAERTSSRPREARQAQPTSGSQPAAWEAQPAASEAQPATEVVQPTVPDEPSVVPYEPMRDPAEDAAAAVAAEEARPEMPAEPLRESSRVVASMPEQELLAEPDTLAYSTGDADTDESIADLTGGEPT